MLSSAISVLLNGGNAKLIGQRPAHSQRPKKRTKEISCQTKGVAVQRGWSRESVTGRISSAVVSGHAGDSNAWSDGVLEDALSNPILQDSITPVLRYYYFTFARAALSGARCQKSSALRLSPFSAPDRL